jgi:hypothetical protein
MTVGGPAAPFPTSIFLVQNRRDIGKYQSKRGRANDGNGALTADLPPLCRLPGSLRAAVGAVPASDLAGHHAGTQPPDEPVLLRRVEQVAQTSRRDLGGQVLPSLRTLGRAVVTQLTLNRHSTDTQPTLNRHSTDTQLTQVS